MKKLKILKYPDERLRQTAVKVTQFGSAMNRFIEQMLEAMYSTNGIGLAASQVDRHIKLFVMDTSERSDRPRYFINPVIKNRMGHNVCEEGCLSVPNFRAPVERSAIIELRWQDVQQKNHYEHFEGIEAICIQHEMDHLLGKLFVDYLEGEQKEAFLAELGVKDTER